MARNGDEGLEQRLDRWVEAGRQLVDGVSGARPGSRRGGSRLNPAELGRWVETKLDWLRDDEDADDWREPWQPQPQPQSQPRRLDPRSRRRPLDAISRRPPAPQVSPAAAASEWPDDALFSVPRWQRQPDSMRSKQSSDADQFRDAVQSSHADQARDAAQASQSQPTRLSPERQSPERQSRLLPRSSRRR